MLKRISRDIGRRWTIAEIDDNSLHYHPLGKCAYVGDIQSLRDLANATKEFLHRYDDCTQIIFRAHAKGIEHLARKCGMVAVVEDIGDSEFTGKRFCGNRENIDRLLAKLFPLDQRFNKKKVTV